MQRSYQDAQQRAYKDPPGKSPVVPKLPGKPTVVPKLPGKPTVIPKLPGKILSNLSKFLKFRFIGLRPQITSKTTEDPINWAAA